MKRFKTLSLKNDKNKIYLAIGDIHGHYRELGSLLEILEKKFPLDSPDYKLVFLGDYIDRGPSCVKTIKKIMEIKKKYKSLILLGNHEYRLLTTNTMYGPSDIDPANMSWIQMFLANEGKLWISTPKFLFIHGGPITSQDDLDAMNPNEYLSNYDAPTEGWNGRTIVRGHKAVDVVTLDDQRISVDTNVCCATGGGQLSCAVLEGSTGNLLETLSVDRSFLK